MAVIEKSTSEKEVCDLGLGIDSSPGPRPRPRPEPGPALGIGLEWVLTCPSKWTLQFALCAAKVFLKLLNLSIFANSGI